MDDLKSNILDSNDDISSKKTPISSCDRCMAVIGNETNALCKIACTK